MVQLTPELKHFADHQFMACGRLEGFASNVRPRVDAATEFTEEALDDVKARLSTIRGYFNRTNTWLLTIVKLDSSTDLQAVSAAARSLFEVAVDLSLLRGYPQRYPYAMVFDWERSCIVKRAAWIKTYFKSRGRPTPEGYRLWHRYLKESEEPAIIEARRQQWWGSKEHPDRWTGRDLLQDVEAAAAVHGDTSLSDFFVTEYSTLSWTTHGSGLAGLRTNTPQKIPASWAICLSWISDFAALAIDLLLKELDLFDVGQFAELRKSIEYRPPSAA
jgi:hypothetical protein